MLNNISCEFDLHNHCCIYSAIVRRTVAELMTGAQGTLIMHKYKKLKFIDTRKLSSLVVWHELDFSPQFR